MSTHGGRSPRMRLAQRLAVVERLDRGELLGVLFEQIADAPEHASAFRRVHLRHDGSPSARLAAFTAASTSAAPAAPPSPAWNRRLGSRRRRCCPRSAALSCRRRRAGTTSEKRLRTRAGSITRPSLAPLERLRMGLWLELDGELAAPVHARGDEPWGRHGTARVARRAIRANGGAEGAFALDADGCPLAGRRTFATLEPAAQAAVGVGRARRDLRILPDVERLAAPVQASRRDMGIGIRGAVRAGDRRRTHRG